MVCQKVQGKERMQGRNSLELLLGSMGKSGKTLDKFSIQIMNEKGQRKRGKETLLTASLTTE